MYDEFPLKKLPEGELHGYLWDLDDPERVVCIVHGIGEYGGRFDRVACRFRDAGMAVVSMDLRGHGKSPGKKGHCAPREKVLSDIDALISWAMEKYPGKKIVLYGHSMGGNIALDYRKRGKFSHIPSAYLISAPWIELVRPIPSVLYRAVKAASKGSASAYDRIKRRSARLWEPSVGKALQRKSDGAQPHIAALRHRRV